MAQPQSMADFVDIGLERIGVEPGAKVGQPISPDIHRRVTNEVSDSGGGGEGAFLVILEGDLRAGGNLDEVHAKHIGPQFERLTCQEDALAGQSGQVDGNRSALIDIEPPRGTRPAPETFHQLVGDLIKRELG